MSGRESVPPLLLRYLEECGSFCPRCGRTDQLRRWMSSARHVPGDGPRTVEVICSCSGCGSEWFERYVLACVSLTGLDWPVT